MDSGPQPCKHCGTPVPPIRPDGFCCAGCAYVYDLLHDQGLERFYDLRGGDLLPPVPAQALRERDYEWLDQLSAAAEARCTACDGGSAELRLSIQGLSCIGCVWLIEKCLSRHDGAQRVLVDTVRGELQLFWQPGRFSPSTFAAELQQFGYLLGPPRMGEEARQASGLERRMGLCGAFAMNAMAFSLPAYFGMPADFLFARWFDLIAALSATLSLLVGGSYFAIRSWNSLRAGALHIDTPITLGIAAAWLGSVGGWIAGIEGLKYFDFVATFIFLMLAGRWAQQAAVERNRRRLMRDTSIPDTVAVEREDGTREQRPLSTLKSGVRFQIKPAQTVPVAARLCSPSASASLEWINGETEAQPRERGQLLPSGALNISPVPIDLEALETWEASTLHRLLATRRPGEQRDHFLERILRVYLAAVVLAGIAGAVWWWFDSGSLSKALQVMISVFVVSCPCALGVAAPLADELAVSRAEKLGVFVRTLPLWKRLNRVRRAVFDKTGTLTLENPVLQRPELLAQLDRASRDALRHLIEGNLHPVSRSLFDQLGPGRDSHSEPVEEMVGHGLRFTDAHGAVWMLARPAADQGQQGDAIFSRDGQPVASFSFRDQLRAESIDEVRHLSERGVQVHILSGDRDAKVRDIAGQLGLNDSQWTAGCTPEQKADWVKQHNDDDLLYVGDGANDSLAFDAAWCAGSPVSGRSFLEQKADFYFLGHSLRFVSGLLDVAQQHRKAVHRVFAFSAIYNLATAAVGLGGHLSPLLAAILMPLSSVATLSLVAVTFRRRRMNSAPSAQDAGRTPQPERGGAMGPAL